MEKVTKLSIIIPMYNAERYISNIFSYFSKYSDYAFELVFIDDKSTDSTVEKLQTNAQNSNLCIKIIQNEENLGPGGSRNKGVAESSGEYITFLDSDDAFTNHYFDEIMPLLDQDYDVIVHDAQLTFDNKTPKHYPMFTIDMDEGLLEKKKALVFINGCTWGKVYKKALIKRFDIEFLNIKRNEDTPFTKIAIASATNICYIKKALYEYYQNNNSLMHNNSLLTAENAQKSFMYVSDKLKDSFPHEIEALFLVEYLYSTVLTNSLIMNRKELINYISLSESIFPNCYNNEYLKLMPKKNILVLKLIKFRSARLIRFMARIRNRK